MAIHTTEDMLSLSLHTDAWDFTGVSTDIIVDFLELVEDLHYWLAERLEGSAAENKEIMLAFSKGCMQNLVLSSWPTQLAAADLCLHRDWQMTAGPHLPGAPQPGLAR